MRIQLIAALAMVALACGDDANTTSTGDGSTSSSNGATSGATSGAGGGATSSTGQASTSSSTASSTGTGGAGGGESFLFADDYNRPDTTEVLDNAWITNVQPGDPIDSTFTVSSDRAIPFFGTSAGGPFLEPVPSAFRPEVFDQENIRVGVDLIAEGGNYDGVALLFARSSETMGGLYDTYFCGFLAASKKLYIMRISGRVLGDLAISPNDVLPLPDGTTSRLTFTLQGPELTCQIEGPTDATLTATDATFSEGYFGMAGGKPNANHLRFDDFVIDVP